MRQWPVERRTGAAAHALRLHGPAAEAHLVRLLLRGQCDLLVCVHQLLHIRSSEERSQMRQ